MADKSFASSIRSALQEASVDWSAGITSVSELSADEKKRRLGYVPGPLEPSLVDRVQSAKATYSAAALAGAPALAAFDLRNVGGKNFITAIKDQADCGSCVAFGAVATVEGTLRRARNNPNLVVDLSEAHLFFCHARSQGRDCNNGWWVPPALDACRELGVVDDACYPYTSGDRSCASLCADSAQRATRIAGWSSLKNANDMKLWLSSKGPLAACFTVYDDFFAYLSGVYRHVTGGVAGGHCVSVVGYNDAGQYWICKNSWGLGFGEQGFFRIAYGECGIDAEMWGVTVNQVADTVPLYRYWNSGGVDHFYTTSWRELGYGRNGWVYEGIQAFIHAKRVAGSVPLYRYWNAGSQDHFYTTNWSELGGGRGGYGYEGIQGFVFPTQVAGTVPLYRYWNGSGTDHFYTTNWGELGGGRNGWGYEGIQCYVFPAPAGARTPAPSGGSNEGPTSDTLLPSDAAPEDANYAAEGAPPPSTNAARSGGCGCQGQDAPPPFSAGESAPFEDWSARSMGDWSAKVTDDSKRAGHDASSTVTIKIDVRR